MKITFSRVMVALQIIACLSLVALIIMNFFTSVEISNETLIIVGACTAFSFLEYGLKALNGKPEETKNN